jgi:haloalkane dehalogenase
MPTIDILDSFMSHRDTGDGDLAVVFLHGNPLSSYSWRNVIPHVAGMARCLAPDLIGMGDSGKPDIAYRFGDHARYLDAWFDAVVTSDVVIVGHDWGGALGMDWATRHASRVRGVAVIETFLRPLRWDEMAPAAAERFRGFRSARGEEMILEKNLMIEGNLPLTVQSGLGQADLDVYREPFLEPASRTPMLAWTREFPLDGEPADVAETVLQYGDWMSRTPHVPKLLMTVENGVGLGSPEIISWAAETFAAAEVASVGPGGHQALEDQPDRIGKTVAQWLAQRVRAAVAEVGA